MSLFFCPYISYFVVSSGTLFNACIFGPESGLRLPMPILIKNYFLQSNISFISSESVIAFFMASSILAIIWGSIIPL